MSKGRKVMVVGRLQTRNWEAQDGTKRSKTEIVASDINFVDKPKDGAVIHDLPERDISADVPKEKAEKKEEKKSESKEEIDIEDIPF